MIHSDFVHLHVHTQYSLLDGACQLSRLVDKAVKLKMPAIAMTDHGNLFGAIRFYSLCMKKGIKPIIGCEVYVAPDSRFNREYNSPSQASYHLVLLVKDDLGYKNLLALTSLANLEGFYYKPRIDKELLAEHSKGLIGLSACLKGEIANAILNDDLASAYKLADKYSNIFGEGNFYLELMDNGMPEQKKVNKHLIKMSKELNLGLVATNDVHYLNREHAFSHEALLAIQTQTTIDDPKRFKMSSDTFYLRSAQEMKEIFADVPQAVSNTLEIMQKCNMIFDFSQTHLPKFPLPKGTSENDFLRELCLKTLPEYYPKRLKQAEQRLEHELDVIKQTGFPGYFIIVWDLIKFARESKIPVGPGRGSAAGSIVSYLLGITDIDPLKYNLIFERFLNPARISMPDIDMDFCYEKRNLVIDYVTKKYGKDHVAQIITFGTMLARAVIRDVGRVLGMSYGDVDKIAKMIPSIPGQTTTLKEALKVNPDLNNIYESDSQVKRLIDVAMQLEGLSRHASTHAAGVVISDKPLIERIPLTRGNAGEVMTSFDMGSLEKTGMLKMDFLGLKTLTVIDETLKIVQRTRKKNIDINKISLLDGKTFELLAHGNTVGVFQLESSGMRDVIKKIIPTRFEDLIAVLALYRPGPLGSGMVDDFIQCKHGKKSIQYPHPKLEKILKETYGIILYQEQTMQIAATLGGFSLAESDLLRKAIGKKIPEIMQEQKAKFIQGCKKNKVKPEVASNIFDLIEYFSGYGFNKSHSTAYAMISYHTAYLKANFPVEFMAALLTSERNNTDKVVQYINETTSMGIKVLPPDINESFANFTVINEKTIRFGLMAIKNVGGAALESIIFVRSQGKFKDFFNFCERVDSRTVNKKVIESLIRSGAMDSLGLKRSQMTILLDKILERVSKKSKVDVNQLSLFETKPKREKIPEVEEWPIQQILGFEKKLLGIYISGHPLNDHKQIIDLLKVRPIEELNQATYQHEVTVVGVIEKIKRTTTRKRNERMAIVKIADQTAEIEVIIFPRTFEECALVLNESKIVVVKGTLQVKESEPKIIAESVVAFDKVLSKVKKMTIYVDKNQLDLKSLKSLFSSNKGDTPVYFVLKNSRFKGVAIKTAQNLHLGLTETLIERMRDTIGEANFSLTL